MATATKLKETWQYMQKEAQMDKLEEDWNGLMQLGYCGFWKPVRLTVFLKVILVDCYNKTFDKMLVKYIWLTGSCDFVIHK